MGYDFCIILAASHGRQKGSKGQVAQHGECAEFKDLDRRSSQTDAMGRFLQARFAAQSYIMDWHVAKVIVMGPSKVCRLIKAVAHV